MCSLQVSFEQKITTSYTGDFKKASFFSAFEGSIKKMAFLKLSQY
jgi:hypothetical protein